MPGPRGLCLLALLLGGPAAPRPDGRPEAALLPASPDPPGAEQPADEAVGSAGGPGHGAALNLLPPAEDGAEPAAEAPTLPTRSHVPPAPAAAPGADAKQTVKKKLPAPKQANAARKHLKPKPTLPGPPKAVSVPGSRLPVSSQEPAEAAAGGDAPRLSPPELPWGGRDPTSRPVLQISPSTLPPAAARPFPSGPGDAGTAPTAAPTGAAVGRTDSAESEGNGSTLEESQETTTSTIITTTVITTEPTPVRCSVSFYDPEGYIDSTDYPPLPLHSYLECTYNVTVYTGYGVELQVKSVNLSDGEVLSIRGVDDDSLVVLANQTLLVEGQVIRSPTNTISVYFRTFQDEAVGTFQLHYQDGRPEAALLPASPDPPGAEQPADEAVGSAGGPGHGAALNLLPPAEDGAEPAAEAPTLPTRSHVPPAPTAAPGADAKQTVKKKLPAPKQANAARKHLKPKPTLPGPPKAVSVPGSRLPVSSQEPAEAAAGGDAPRLSPPELPWGGRDPTSRPVLQISPSTLPPAAARPFPSGPGDAGTAPTAAPTGAAVGRTDSAESEGNGSTLEESQETTTSTIITTTVITTEPTPVRCSVSFYDPEGYIDSTDYPPLPLHSYLECTYNVTVYTGYGVELQVKSVNLSDGEVLSIRGVDDDSLVVLANQTLLVEGQVIRSPTNTISVYFRTFQDEAVGTFQLHYQVFMLSCSFPRRPDFGEVTVMDLHSGGIAHFHCHLGYELQGPKVLTCINASRPHWSSPEPICSAPCGGTVHNATIGRVLSPSYTGNQSSSMYCVWTIGAPPGQKLHLHFEKLLLTEKDRMVVYSGDSNRSAVLYDSLRADSVPFEGVISDGSSIRIDFLAEEPAAATAFNIRFEAFERGHCYEPYIQNGNFTTSDPTYNLGTTVEFTCDPGHSLEQGPAVIECVNMRDPYWNDTEPLCRATCGGELTAVAGVILSPNWPEPYAEGEDCIWRVHVGEEKRLFLDIQLLNLTNSDILTIYDGDELTARILGQYVGSSGPQKLYSSSPDLTIQFHSDPAGLIFGKGQGFIMNYIEVSRNDSCSDLPEIQNGWKTTSHTELVRGAKITYQCDPGYDIVGSDTLTCQWDLSWSSDPPFCEKIMYCTDPGEVEHSTRLISDPVLLVGTTIQYTCNPGFVLEGSSLLTCYSRETGTPIWTSRLPHCVSEESLACDNPGLPENGYQILYKRLYLPGESLTFMCYEGFELMGEVTIKCILGQPSHWSGPLPICKVNQDSFEHALEVAEAAAETSLEGGNMALAIFIPVLIISLLLGGAYIYITRCRYYSSLRLPLMYSHPYSQITVETEFDNPIYETGETREYEVSI